MSKLIQGHRVGKGATLRPGASAIILDGTGEKVLLTQREDNGRWCLPGGGMDPGESAEEACIREVREETGLEVRVTRLIGIYTSPNIIVEYSDGNRIQPVAFSFQATPTGGELSLSDETTAIGYFTLEEMDRLDLMENHKERILDALED